MRPRWRLALPTAGLTGERRETLLWMCVLIGANQLGFGAIVPVAPLYAQGFGVSETAVGLTIGVYGLARFGINVPAGRLADRHGRRRLLALGGIVTVLGNLLCALAPGYAAFLGARFVAGAGAAMVLTGGQTVLADISEPRNRGRVMALYQGVFLFAVGAGPLPGGLLAARFGLAAPFVANAALAALALAVAWLRVPETRGLRRDAAAESSPPLPLRRQLALLRGVPGFGLVGLVSFSIFFARTGALFNVVPLDAERRLGLGPERIGIGLGLISIVGLLLAYPSGMMVDRFGRKAVIVPASLLTAGSMLLFAVVPGWGWFLGACVIWAVATGVGGAAPAAYAADIAPAGMTAAALGSYRMVADAGYVVGPLLLGAIADVASPPAALAVAALVVTGSAIAFARGAPESFASVDAELILPRAEHSSGGEA